MPEEEAMTEEIAKKLFPKQGKEATITHKAKRTDYYVDQPTVKARLNWLIDSGLCPYSIGSQGDQPQGYVCLRRPRENAPKPCSYVDWLTCPVGGLAQALHPPMA